MHGLFRIFERTCGDCGNAPGLPSTSDKAFSYAFVLRPLGGTANPEAVEATRRASELFYKGRIDDALHQFHRAQALAPRAYQAYSNLGSAYHERADDDEALSWYRQAHRLAPRDSIATLALALPGRGVPVAAGQFFAGGKPQPCGCLAAAGTTLRDAEILEPGSGMLQETDAGRPR